MVALLFFSACSPSHKDEVDELNQLSYAYHYRNLDSTKALALRALRLSDDYPAGYAEAHNNLAFVAMAKMDYATAKKHLAEVERRSDNQIEILIADVQNMRLCQRESRNKDFYAYREKASHLLRRIGEEADNLPPRERRRVVYARSEFDIVVAAYFYYVGQEEPMMEALNDIDPETLEQDTAQYLNYLYNCGSGGAITHGTAERINQTEFDYLVNCYMLASSGRPYPYWQANALQAISEHLQKPSMRNFLIRNNLPAIKYLNTEQMPDYLLAGNLAQRALNLFRQYGDIYQTAGAYRTLAECYFAISYYGIAADCLNHALFDHPNITQAPDLVASLREQLSLVYSAIGNKPQSDYNRNIYLDLQEQTRQDRQLEARAAQLDESSNQLNWLIAAVILVIAVVILLLALFDRMRRKSDQRHPFSALLEPLHQWSERNEQKMGELEEKREEIDEAYQMTLLHVSDNKRRHVEQRAKIALVNSITPFIDRIIHEVEQLKKGTDHAEVLQERYEYISELTSKIGEYNQVLTKWIQMRQGTLSMKIESFELQPLFDILQKGKLAFQMKGIHLVVNPTDAVVKADRTLTLFMINTIADNARKFTPEGGTIEVSARADEGGAVEVIISDTGKGMSPETLAHLFDRTYTGGHGFGLLNCKGIIEKYKKVSSIFSVCDIHAESILGKGSRFTFRLPRGLKRMLTMLVLLLALGQPSMADSLSHHRHTDHKILPDRPAADLMKADAFADSAYFCNINGRYERTLQFADSARHYLNRYYLLPRPGGKTLMQRSPSELEPAELKWLHDSVATNYDIILDLRNETAVAALALHKWNLYHSNNQVYTQLFRERSADLTLADYVRTMQLSENSKTVAIILLVLLLLQLPFAYYMLYFRHVLNYRFAVEKVNAINRILLSDHTSEEKLVTISKLWDQSDRLKSIHAQLSEVVGKIEQALRESIANSNKAATDIELAEDELNRAKYENGRLHISNSVLDNCLSALKHETMYYPSRICQLVDSHPGDVSALSELVDYYKALYTMLSAQAMEQVEGYIRYDPDLLRYLFAILYREGGGKSMGYTMEPKDDHYVIYRVPMPKLRLNEEQCRLLFTPLTTGLQFLVCRQVVREVGEVTNMRGCGIQALLSEEQVVVEVILPRNIKI